MKKRLRIGCRTPIGKPGCVSELQADAFYNAYCERLELNPSMQGHESMSKYPFHGGVQSVERGAAIPDRVTGQIDNVMESPSNRDSVDFQGEYTCGGGCMGSGIGQDYPAQLTTACEDRETEPVQEPQSTEMRHCEIKSSISESTEAQSNNLWRIFGEELPENAPHPSDPRWQSFHATATGHQGMYRLDGDNNSSAQGSYADVFKREAWFEGRVRMLVAVKRLRLLNVKDQLRPNISEISEQCRKRLSKETKIWMTLSHPNIAPLLGYDDDRAFCMISPWFENGNIDEYIRRTKPTTPERLRLIIQIASGVAYLHELTPAIVHGDIKPDNIVVDRFGVPWIIDFGLSTVVQDAAGAGFQSLSSRTGGGNSRWIAPELLMNDGKARLSSSDVYSFACTAFFTMTGELPFINGSATEHRVCFSRFQGAQPMGTGVAYPTINSIPGLHDLLQQCWVMDPRERPSMPIVHSALASL